MKFEPLRDIVVVKRDVPESTSAGGIVLTTNSKITPKTGTVLAVGPGYECDRSGKFIKTQVEIGQRVLLTPTAGFPVELDECDPKDDIVVMRELEIMGILL